MNHEEAWNLLNDYVDRTLPDDKMGEMETHLQECRACRLEVEELRALIGRAGDLPRAIGPDRDLWPPIAGRMSPREPGLVQRLLDSLRSWRALQPVAVATAAALVVLIVLAIRGGEPPVPTEPRIAEQEMPEQAAVAVMEALEAECEQGDLEMAEYSSRVEGTQYFPILALITENLRIIDQSITELREAWKANPDSPRVARMLAAAYRAKVALQGRASRFGAET
jgi:hypothetical protein